MGAHEQAFVDNQLRGQAADVELVPAEKPRVEDFALSDLPDDEQLALERRGVRPGALADEQLADHRLTLPGDVTDDRRVHGNVAPAEEPLPLLFNGAHDDRLARLALCAVLRQKHDAGRVAAGLRKVDSLLRHFAAQEIVRHLEQHPGAVAGFGVAARRAAVREIGQHLEPVPDDLIGLHAANVRHNAYSTGAVLELGTVQPKGLAFPNVCHRSLLGLSALNANSAPLLLLAWKPRGKERCSTLQGTFTLQE